MPTPLVEIEPGQWVRPSDIVQVNVRYRREVWATLSGGQSLRLATRDDENEAMRAAADIVQRLNTADLLYAQTRPAN